MKNSSEAAFCCAQMIFLRISIDETNERAGWYEVRGISSFLRTISPAAQEPS